MTGTEFRVLTRTVLSTLSFAWLQMKPDLMQTYHQLALDSTPALGGMRAPLDAAVHDLILGTEIRPSAMQAHLLDTVVPVMLVAIQSIAEDSLEGVGGVQGGAFRKIEALVAVGRIDRGLASRAHQWRIVRNVVAHAGGVIDADAVGEVTRLHADGLVLFRTVKLWGQLLDAGHGGNGVPVTDRVVANPGEPEPWSPEVELVEGTRLQVGVGDLLAAADVWAELIDRAA